jgi:hypothetical protein
MAGFGTAGCVLACAAGLFAIAGGIVGFRGWPQVGGQGLPAAVAVTPGPASAGPASGPRGAAPGLGAAFVTTVVPVAHSVRRTGGAGDSDARQGTHDADRLGPKLPTQAGSGRPTGTGPTGTGSGPTGTGGGPPTTVPPPTNPPVATPRPPGGPGTLVDKVSAAAGGAVSGAGSRLGSAVGGSAGAAVTKVAGGAGGTVSKLGAGVGNLLGG